MDERNEVESKLKNHALDGCKKCYGRGYLGFNREKKKIILCKCLRKEALRKTKERFNKGANICIN